MLQRNYQTILLGDHQRDREQKFPTRHPSPASKKIYKLRFSRYKIGAGASQLPNPKKFILNTLKPRSGLGLRFRPMLGSAVRPTARKYRRWKPDRAGSSGRKNRENCGKTSPPRMWSTGPTPSTGPGCPFSDIVLIMVSILTL